MDIQSNAAVSGGLPEEFLPGEITEGGDGVSLEWLSIFVEDCLSGGFTGQPLPTPTTTTITTTTTTTNHPTPSPITPEDQNPKPSFHQNLSIPSKARTKRRKLMTSRANSNNHHQTFHVNPSDPPLLPQTYWLADSELIFPVKEHEDRTPKVELVGGEGGEGKLGKDGSQGQQPRRCTHCLSQKTPQWRAGPLGPKTLCNACGVRFKSGRLLPEYRPAKSPTFESYKHSNSHKKVMEMRMTILSSHTN